MLTKPLIIAIVGIVAGVMAFELLRVTVGDGSIESTGASPNELLSERIRSMISERAPDRGEDASDGSGQSFAPAPRSTAESQIPGPSRVEAILALADEDPRSAIDAVMAIEPYWHRLDVLERVVAAWARRSPFDALAYVEGRNTVDAEVRSRNRLSVLSEWADIESSAVLSWFLTREGQNLFFRDPIVAEAIAQKVSGQQARPVIAAAESLPRGRVRASLYAAGTLALVEQDLEAAIQLAGLAADYLDRTLWAAAIGPELARRDPSAALAWADRFDAELPGTRARVSQMVENFDAER